MSLKKLGRYDLIRVLGKGAMGLVYEGRDPNLERHVAVKVIRVEYLSEQAAADYEHRFRVEARSAARLQHPNIVSVYDAGRDGDMAFLVMELIQGDDLKHHLDQGNRYSLSQAVRIMDDLLSALDYAHRQGIVHRDIKPANLLIETNGRVKLTDFGVARMQDSGDATRTHGAMVGTLKYMSPEQVQGRPVDARADLFAAGVVLYQLLTGKRPFDGETDFSVIQQVVGHHPAAPSTLNPSLPLALDAVMALALAKSPDQRFDSAQAFSAALNAAYREAANPGALPPTGLPGSVGADGLGNWPAAAMSAETVIAMPPPMSPDRGAQSFEATVVFERAQTPAAQAPAAATNPAAAAARVDASASGEELHAQASVPPAEHAAAPGPVSPPHPVRRARTGAWILVGGAALIALGLGAKAWRPAPQSPIPQAAGLSEREEIVQPGVPATAALPAVAQVAPAASAGQVPGEAAAAPGTVAAAKPSIEKKALARPATRAAADAGSLEPASVAAPLAAAPRVSSNPSKPLCEGKILISYQVCMQTECNTPALTHHPLCVERRAMEQRRRDAQLLR